MKRSPLKRRPKPRVSMAGFWSTVTEDGTAPCALAHLGGCAGPLDAHHTYPKTRLKHRLPKEMHEAALTDPRGGQPLCRTHHEAVEWRRVECPRPPEMDGFLADFGLVERTREAA